MKKTATTVTLKSLTKDSRNANKGNKRGRQMLEASLRDLGAGRSILLDKKGRIIAGNKAAEAAQAAGYKNVIVVETTGQDVIAVKRMDLDLEKDAKAKSLAVADNRVGELGLTPKLQNVDRKAKTRAVA